MANEIRFGLASVGGDVVGGALESPPVLDGMQGVYEMNFPETTEAAQGWWFSLPEGAVLVNVVSLGVETTAQWVMTADGERYFLFFGLPGVKNRATIRATLPGVRAVGVGAIDLADVLDVARVAYAPVELEQAEITRIQTYLRDAIRLNNSDAINARLLQLFKAALREVETYCQHALFFRSFTSTIIFQDPGFERLASVNGRWRHLVATEEVTANGLPVVIEPSGHFYAVSGVMYRASFTLAPFDGPVNAFGDDVLEALARLIGYRWDGGIYQRSALWQSGCLDGVSRYVNREAVTL